MITKNAAWELGFNYYDIGEDDDFGSNSEDLEAINTYILGLPTKVDNLYANGKITKARYEKFFQLFDDWKKFYYLVKKSWYVSDSDINQAKLKRDEINLLIMPEVTKQVKKYSSQPGPVLQKDIDKYQKETKTFWQRNWLPMTGIVLIGGIAGYFLLTGIGLAFISRKSPIVKGMLSV
jgi:hypothetical protein